MNMMKAFLADEAGTTVVGYGILSCVVSIPMVGGLAMAAGSLSELLLSVAEIVGGTG